MLPGEVASDFASSGSSLGLGHRAGHREGGASLRQHGSKLVLLSWCHGCCAVFRGTNNSEVTIAAATTHSRSSQSAVSSSSSSSSSNFRRRSDKNQIDAANVPTKSRPSRFVLRRRTHNTTKRPHHPTRNPIQAHP